MKVPVGSPNEHPVIDKEIVLGDLEPSMVASLAVAWLLVFFCVFNGVHTMNKVVYVTATLPYVIMIVLLTRAITLEGAGNGLALLIPDVGRLSEKAVSAFSLSYGAYNTCCRFGFKRSR
jgi:solute carrier family 6 GABA transporter-like protein 1